MTNTLKAPEPKMDLKLLFIAKDQKGSGFYRIIQPASKIKDAGLAEVQINDRLEHEQVGWADVIILQRANDPFMYEAIDKARSALKYVVYELDDLLYGMGPDSNPLAWRAWNPATELLGRALRIMSMCDAVTVTTDRLAAEYALFNRHVFVLPNYLDKDLWDNPRGWTVTDWNFYFRKKNDDIIRIGWAGAAGHKPDLEMISNVMTNLAARYPKVRFILFGFTPKEVFGMIPLRENICVHCGVEGQMEVESGVGLLEYPAKLKSLALDIGLAPLVENSFNECKSDLKLKEYAALGIPVVASGIKPYSPSLKHGVTGYLANSGKEWFDYLELLIQDRGKRQEMGKAAYQFYRESTVDRHIHKWIEVYRQVVNPKFNW